jgi:hypothetical protein
MIFLGEVSVVPAIRIDAKEVMIVSLMGLGLVAAPQLLVADAAGPIRRRRR